MSPDEKDVKIEALAAEVERLKRDDLSGQAIMEARAYLVEHLGKDCERAFFDDCIHNVVARCLSAEAALDRERARSAMLRERAKGILPYDTSYYSLGDQALAAALAATDADVDSWLCKHDQRMRADGFRDGLNHAQSRLVGADYGCGGRCLVAIRALAAAPETTP